MIFKLIKILKFPIFLNIKFLRFRYAFLIWNKTFQSGLIEEGSYTLDEIDTYSGNLQLADHDGQEILLFDLEADPYELVNVYDSTTHFDIVDSMMNTINTKGKLLTSILIISWNFLFFSFPELSLYSQTSTSSYIFLNS